MAPCLVDKFKDSLDIDKWKPIDKWNPSCRTVTRELCKNSLLQRFARKQLLLQPQTSNGSMWLRTCCDVTKSVQVVEYRPSRGSPWVEIDAKTVLKNLIVVFTESWYEQAKNAHSQWVSSTDVQTPKSAMKRRKLDRSSSASLSDDSSDDDDGDGERGSTVKVAAS